LPNSKKEKFISPLFYQTILSGIIAGLAEVSINHPLWVMKTRIQSGNKNVWELRGLYRGLSSNMISMIPLIALRLSLSTYFQNTAFNNQAPPTSFQLMISALIGGSIPSFIGSPLEFIRTKQINYKMDMISTAKTLVQQNGGSIFLSGMFGTIARDALYTCGFFALAPIIKGKIRPYCHDQWTVSAISRPLAGIFTAFVSQPIDTIKIHQQMVSEKRKISMLEASKEIIKNDGFGGFFKGATPRILRVISAVSIISTVNDNMTSYFEKIKK
jgi:solute carrier family 25 (mitochondrial citrate transporter), member 1